MMNDRSLSAQLAPRQSAALVAATAAVACAVIVALMTLGGAAASLVTWCRHFVIVASAGRIAAVGAVVILLGGLALASVLNLFAFIVTEALTALRFSSRVRRTAVPMSGRVRAALSATGIDTPTVVVDDAAPFAVSVGMVSPRIVVSTGLLSAMTLAELRAVLAHESGHVRARHPLRAVMWEAIRRSVFFLPVIGDIAAHFALSREIAADRHAVSSCGQRPLASALLKIVSGGSPQRFPLASAPFGHLRSRINALSGARKTELCVSLRRIYTSLAVVGIIATAHVALAATADDPVAGQRCVSQDVPAMSQINFSPDFSIRVPSMSSMPAADLDDLRAAVPVQSSAIRP